jgi:hypothetical protein
LPAEAGMSVVVEAADQSGAGALTFGSCIVASSTRFRLAVFPDRAPRASRAGGSPAEEEVVAVREPQEVMGEEYERVLERVAAVDVAKASGMVCTRVPHPSRPGRRLTRAREVDATTGAVLELAGYLAGERIERVTLESASDYWRIWLRREAPCCIPGLAGGNLEDIPGSDGLLKIRKVKGTIACQETSGRANSYGRCAGGPARYG